MRLRSLDSYARPGTRTRWVLDRRSGRVQAHPVLWPAATVRKRRATAYSMFAYMRRYLGRMVIVLTLVTPLLVVMTCQRAPRRGQRDADELVTVALASAHSQTAAQSMRSADGAGRFACAFCRAGRCPTIGSSYAVTSRMWQRRGRPTAGIGRRPASTGSARTYWRRSRRWVTGVQHTTGCGFDKTQTTNGCGIRVTHTPSRLSRAR